VHFARQSELNFVESSFSWEWYGMIYVVDTEYRVMHSGCMRTWNVLALGARAPRYSREMIRNTSSHTDTTNTRYWGRRELYLS